MIPRKISINFSDVPLHWTRIPEFATMQNAGSPIASQSEIFVNGMMAKAKKYIAPEKTGLLEEMRIFVEQESNHCNLHASFNRELYARGYHAVREYEARMRIFYKNMLKDRSVQFCAAYCAGFENIALFSSKFAFEHAPDLFEGGDQRMVDLYKWHLAEEFEHRTVAHAVFKEVSGNYFMRLYGTFVAFRSLNKFQKDIYEIITKIDYQSISKEEIEQSKKREKRLKKRMAFYIIPRMLKIVLPYYNPENHSIPQSVQESLDYYEKMAAA
ncbi:metal-dependent hydrolase [Sphingobium sp. CR2-8]|uniref:metal-dependent hydrolase n=1 Tax=Sphingobium sp. CR2-8 TaxID=1306534 RepID=UPI002DB82247|nr:metal-dependent hydrolase [Sphingobium sp. CR2-8]MEC3909391.1 metal-dependent hydrolase [Sphingobium sp. CR2-8]